MSLAVAGSVADVADILNDPVNLNSYNRPELILVLTCIISQFIMSSI